MPDLDLDDDDTATFIRSQIAAQGGGESDEDDLPLAPLDLSDGAQTVSQEEGTRLASDARLDLPKPDATRTPEGQQPGAAGPKDDGAKDDTTPPGTDAAAAEPRDWTQAPVADLMADMPEDRRAEITRRLATAEAAFAPFAARREELARLNTTPEAAAARLLELHDFARQKPDEYLAWVAREMGGDKAHEALDAAAKHLGYKVVRDAPEEDEDLLDPEVKRLREENARLRGSSAAFGPDTPQRQAARAAQGALDTFLSERDETGQPKRPYFRQLEPRITALAQEHVRATGRALTVADLGSLYDRAVDEVRQIVPAASTTPAATAQPSVAQGDTTKAAAGAKAQRASKSVDGTGQGADRRPAISEGADVGDVIRHFRSSGPQ